MVRDVRTVNELYVVRRCMLMCTKVREGWPRSCPVFSLFVTVSLAQVSHCRYHEIEVVSMLSKILFPDFRH